MRRTTSLLVLAVLGLAAFAMPASAQAAKFHSTSSSVDDDGALVVSWDQRGVGNETVDYELRAEATETWACMNRGGKNPSAANKRSQSESVTTAGSFDPTNGRIQATLTSDAPSPDGFSCPGGQQLVLASVSYHDIVLTDTTNDVSTTVDDAERTFHDV